MVKNPLTRVLGLLIPYSITILTVFCFVGADLTLRIVLFSFLVASIAEIVWYLTFEKFESGGTPTPAKRFPKGAVFLFDFFIKVWQIEDRCRLKELTMAGKKVRVFAAYQICIGNDTKMIGDEALNKFEVTYATTSEMIREVEVVLAERHKEDVEKRGAVIIIHHFQLISF